MSRIPITSPKIEEYLFDLARKYDEPVLLEMEAYGHRNKFPIIDRLVGAMLLTITKISGAKTVFEMGSGYGYSAYWFAKALGSKGHVTCTDGDPKNKEKADNYLSSVGLWDRIDFRMGDAIEILKQNSGGYDIIYCDIDKHGYPHAWEAAKKKLKPSGIYICDNTLWSGRVAEAHVTDDIKEGWTEAIREHNRKIYSDPNFDVTLVPLRDGVIIARKKELKTKDP